jgi:hypothetical protein
MTTLAEEQSGVVALAGLKVAELVHQLDAAFRAFVHLQRQTDFWADAELRPTFFADNSVGARPVDVFEAL